MSLDRGRPNMQGRLMESMSGTEVVNGNRMFLYLAYPTGSVGQLFKTAYPFHDPVCLY